MGPVNIDAVIRASAAPADDTRTEPARSETSELAGFETAIENPIFNLYRRIPPLIYALFGAIILYLPR
jgi:hypothetical protein